MLCVEPPKTTVTTKGKGSVDRMGNHGAREKGQHDRMSSLQLGDKGDFDRMSHKLISRKRLVERMAISTPQKGGRLRGWDSSNHSQMCRHTG